MGRTISYCVVNDGQLKLLLNAEDVDTVLKDDILLFHEYKSLPFWCSQISFGQGVKAWNPMLELLIHLNASEASVFRYLLDQLKFKEYLVFTVDEVEKVWKELKSISIRQIETALDDPDLVDKISKIEGYRMNGIQSPKLIITEFMELINAFYRARQSNLNVFVYTD